MKRYRQLTYGTLVSFGLWLGMVSGAPAAMTHQTEDQATSTHQTTGFQRLEQPFWLKAVVTAGGLGFIGLELWWFVVSRPQAASRKSKPSTSPTSQAGPASLGAPQSPTGDRPNQPPTAPSTDRPGDRPATNDISPQSCEP